MIKSLIEHDFQVLSSWKDVQIQELNNQKGHVYMVCSIPPKISVSQYIGIIKEKIAIKLFKTYPSLKQKP
ncbi:transposase [Aquimarina agarilytica]|uniref:transposase n=1 Tax=Aquimarina agarilytica TaxID=1087449 RepID=UPI000289AC17|nr:transposase [Aquimarina agarilytica]